MGIEIYLIIIIILLLINAILTVFVWISTKIATHNQVQIIERSEYWNSTTVSKLRSIDEKLKCIDNNTKHPSETWVGGPR